MCLLDAFAATERNEFARTLFHLKPAGWCWSPDAMFFNWRADYLSEQRFCQETCFGMICRSGSDRTASAIDKMLSTFFPKTGGAAEFLENAQGSINSLLASLMLHAAQIFLGYSSSGQSHSSAQPPGFHMTREYRHEERDQSSIGFGKKVFGFRAKSISRMRFSNARLQPGLRHQPVSFKAGKVRSHGVISKVQFFCELVHGAFSCVQKVEDFPSRAFEQPLPPAYIFHYIKDHGVSY